MIENYIIDTETFNLDDFKQMFNQFGLHFYIDPIAQFASDFGIIISDKPLTKEEIFEHTRAQLIDLPEEELDSIFETYEYTPNPDYASEMAGSSGTTADTDATTIMQ